MPQVTSSLKTAGSTWTPSDILNRWGSNYSRLSHENPAFDLGRINNRGQIEFQKDKPQQWILTRFQIGDYVSGKKLEDETPIRGRIVSIVSKEGVLDKVFILHNGKRVRIDAASMIKLAESSVSSFGEFNKLLESYNS
jgi:hypothetical protein